MQRLKRFYTLGIKLTQCIYPLALLWVWLFIGGFISQAQFAAAAANRVSPLTIDTRIMHTEPWGFYCDPQSQNKTPLVISAQTQYHQDILCGIWPDIAQYLAKKAGLNLQLSLEPYGGIWQSLDTGQADLSFLIRSAERSHLAPSQAHMFDFASVVIARAGIHLTDYQDLQNLRIGVLRGIRLSPRFDHDPKLNKIQLRNYELMVDMLLHQRLDAIAGNNVSLLYLLQKKQALDKVNVQPLILQKTHVYLHMAAGLYAHPYGQVLIQANQALREQGIYQHLIDAYVGSQWRLESQP